jgi:hypothetical protein
MSILVDNCIWILAGSRQIDALSECAHSIPKELRINNMYM